MTRIVRQIAHVCIFAHDLDATERFYTDVLGLEVAFRFTRKGAPYGYYLAVGQDTWIEVFQKSETSFSDANQINHICLEVVDMDAAIAHIRANGVTTTDKSKGVDETWQSWTADPNGVKIELFQYTGESAQFLGGDRVANW